MKHIITRHHFALCREWIVVDNQETVLQWSLAMPPSIVASIGINAVVSPPTDAPWYPHFVVMLDVDDGGDGVPIWHSKLVSHPMAMTTNHTSIDQL